MTELQETEGFNFLEPTDEHITDENFKKYKQSIFSVFLMSLYRFVDVSQLFYNVRIRVTSQIPIGAGLGSSAAWSVGITTALYKVKNKTHQNTKK